jgi:hypothetical protein
MGKNTDHTRNNINYDKKMSEIPPISTKQTTASHQKSLLIPLLVDFFASEIWKQQKS